MTKSATATPGRVDLAVNTVKMEGSCTNRTGSVCGSWGSGHRYSQVCCASSNMTHGVVEGHTVYNHEVLQVVLVGCVVAMPGGHIERGEILQAEHIHSKINKTILPKQQTQRTLN